MSESDDVRVISFQDLVKLVWDNVKVKQSVLNISYFNKHTVFTIRKKQTIDNIMYHWVKSPLAQLNKRFSRSERFALK